MAMQVISILDREEGRFKSMYIQLDKPNYMYAHTIHYFMLLGPPRKPNTLSQKKKEKA